jgi:oxidoreductase
VQDVNADAVVICLGTTRAAAGGMEQFVKIDREYVLAAAKAGRVPGKEQRLVYCSVRPLLLERRFARTNPLADWLGGCQANGASSSSLIPYSTSKGLTEEGLAALGYETIIFRPGMLNVPGGRAEHRLLESIAMSAPPSLLSRDPANPPVSPLVGKSLASFQWSLRRFKLRRPFSAPP